MKKSSWKIYKKLILLYGILLIVSSSYSVAQSKTDIRISNYDPVKDEVVSKLVMHKIMQDLNAYEALKIKHSEERERLSQEVEKLNRQMEEISKKSEYETGKLARENLLLAKALETAERRAKAYKDLAHKKSLLATKMKKWRGKYYSLLSISMVKISIPLACFLTGTYFIMKNID